jgi:GNAT superfamily N-acetyltransferase
MEIRSYRDDDHPACRTLWVELTEHHRRIYEAPDIGGDDPGSDFDRHLDRYGGQDLWVAVLDGSIIGLAGLIAADDPELEPLIVSDRHRGLGVARALVDRVATEARERGHRMLSVRPVARNASALAAFKALGFGTLGHVELLMELGDSARAWLPEAEIRGTRFSV